MTKRTIIPYVTLAALALSPDADAQVLQAISLFEVHCASCHASPTDGRTPPKEALRALTPEAVLAALTTGAMVEQASELRDGQKRLLAEHVAGAPLGSARTGDASAMPNRCAAGAVRGPVSLGRCGTAGGVGTPPTVGSNRPRPQACLPNRCQI